MAETLDSAPPPLFHTLDPMSLVFSQNSMAAPVPLRLMTECYVKERGPRYRAYAELRESKLRLKKARLEDREESESKQTAKKQVKFSSNFGDSRKGVSAMEKSVPDFSTVLRKENRKPVTPPSAKSKGAFSNSRGSKSVYWGEKKGMAVARKSYACVEELKGISSAAANAINGENRGGRSMRSGGTSKTVLGYRQY